MSVRAIKTIRFFMKLLLLVDGTFPNNLGRDDGEYALIDTELKDFAITGALDEKSQKHLEWSLRVDTLAEDLQKMLMGTPDLQERLEGAGKILKGYLSPISNTIKKGSVGAEGPPDVVFYAFSYPLELFAKAVPKPDDLKRGSTALAQFMFLTVGGFIYWNAERTLLTAHAMETSGDEVYSSRQSLHFGEASRWSNDDWHKWDSDVEARFRPVIVRQQQEKAKSICWARPSEMRECPLGGFAFDMLQSEGLKKIVFCLGKRNAGADITMTLRIVQLAVVLLRLVLFYWCWQNRQPIQARAAIEARASQPDAGVELVSPSCAADD